MRGTCLELAELFIYFFFFNASLFRIYFSVWMVNTGCPQSAAPPPVPIAWLQALICWLHSEEDREWRRLEEPVDPRRSVSWSALVGLYDVCLRAALPASAATHSPTVRCRFSAEDMLKTSP